MKLAFFSKKSNMASENFMNFCLFNSIYTYIVYIKIHYYMIMNNKTIKTFSICIVKYLLNN